MRFAPLLARPATHKALHALIVVLAVVFLMQTYHRAMRPDGYDFASYRQSARALAAGTDPYRTATPFPYIYPLFLAFVLVPLAYLPYAAAVGAWYLLGIASLYGALRLAGRFSTGPLGAPVATGVSLLALLAALDPIQIDLLNGQVNTEVLLLCLLFFLLYEKKSHHAAAVCLGAAAALKIVPLVLLIFLALRREGRLLMATIGVTTAFCLAPIVLVGHRIWPLYAEYARGFLLARAQSGARGGIDFTPYGLVGRALPALAGSPWVRFGTVAFVLGAIAFVQMRRRQEPSYRYLALYLAAVPLLSPLSEVHHLIFALPAAVLLSVEALASGGRVRAGIVASAVLFWMGLWIGRLDRSGPYYLVALTALVAGLLLATIRSDRSDGPPPRPHDAA